MTFEAVSYESIPHALVSGIIISILCSAVGLFLVLRRYSLFGDALAHSAFGGVALGLFIGLYPLWLACIVAILSALGLTKIRQKFDISSDAIVAILLATGLGAGVILVSMHDDLDLHDIEEFLFGSAIIDTQNVITILAMAGAILALAAAFAVTITVNTGNPLVGALLFPVGFCILYLLGFDLLTGVFTLVPLAVFDRRPGVDMKALWRNWGLVFVGNFAGAMTTAIFMAIIMTMGFTVEPDAVGQKLMDIGHSRTVGYAEAGAGGMLTLFIRAVMCNWMVSTGVVAAMMSSSVPGKIMGIVTNQRVFTVDAPSRRACSS